MRAGIPLFLAVVPITQLKDANASSSVLYISAFSTILFALDESAILKLFTSQSGFTNAKFSKPMFFINLATEPIFPG